ncbi:MAG: mandelate racemase/muconate lactonizing enzyme family protein [Armatimonadota bacterium]|nr:mandelate racemase/muconate lactonizing enzyme family protein [Armatimonadota bacterium]
MIRVKDISCDFEREPLIAPLGFKGKYLTQLWQSIAYIRAFSGSEGLGIGTQSVLWSDAELFAGSPESASNAFMFATTFFALSQVRDRCFSDPVSLLDDILRPVTDYAKSVTSYPGLRPTFVLNALVPVDNAAWQLYAAEHGLSSFDEIIPDEFKPALSHRHRELGLIPLVSYGVSVEDVVDLVRAGVFVLKIKIGCDPDGDGDPEKMLEWDTNRVLSIHHAVEEFETPYTDSQRVVYYLDANGQYESKDHLLHLIDRFEREGILDRVILLEEPFPEGSEISVEDLPVRVAGDESAHSVRHVAELIDLGYTAIALKPVAKTLSETLKIATLAHDKGIHCFCADLTANPILVDWNKNVAARLAPLPGLRIGILEMNGDRNYKNWVQMCNYHPKAGAPWTVPVGGVFRLDDSFYESSGGILEQSEHYRSLVVS